MNTPSFALLLTIVFPLLFPHSGLTAELIEPVIDVETAALRRTLVVHPDDIDLDRNRACITNDGAARTVQPIGDPHGLVLVVPRPAHAPPALGIQGPADWTITVEAQAGAFVIGLEPARTNLHVKAGEKLCLDFTGVSLRDAGAVGLSVALPSSGS
ncbi:MAG: hypothetical protein AAF533_29450 [Acidobacteriota bacterium]